MTRDLAPLLVRRVLENPKLEWSYQGFGMLRHYLSKAVRLHIWDPTRAVPHVSVIHDHPWDFESLVVCGSIENTLYWRILSAEECRDPENWEGRSLKSGLASAASFANGPASHLLEKIVCGPSGHALGCALPVRLTKYSSVRYRAGESYAEQREWLHESRPEPGTVTIVTRKFYQDTEHARVCYPLGTEWVSAEPRPATEEEVAHFTALALGRLAEVL